MLLLIWIRSKTIHWFCGWFIKWWKNKNSHFQFFFFLSISFYGRCLDPLWAFVFSSSLFFFHFIFFFSFYIFHLSIHSRALSKSNGIIEWHVSIFTPSTWWISCILLFNGNGRYSSFSYIFFLCFFFSSSLFIHFIAPRTFKSWCVTLNKCSFCL